MDHDISSRYSLIVKASDKGATPKSDTKLILIDILDVNDKSPSFSTSSITYSVKESVPIGEEVGSSLDRESGHKDVSYKISSGNTGDVFDINKATGQIYTIKEVDFEKTAEYQLKIEKIDFNAPNPQESIIKVKIVVEDINDDTPTFLKNPITVSVSESLDIGSSVYNFSAADLDSGENGRIEYSLAQQAPKNVFKLDINTGELSLIAPLDFEEQTEFTLVVIARDQPRIKEESLQSSLTVKLLVQDYNDNAPRFVSSNRVDIMEDEPVGYPMLHVIATDEDSGDNGRVNYWMSSGNDEKRFKLDYETGVLTIVKSLDRETTKSYKLNITASDRGKPNKASSQLVEIFVEDVNDNPPKFTKVVYKAEILESSPPGTFVTRVTASDNDSGSNSNLTFIIPAGIGDNKFRINPATGEIHTVATLDREQKEQYSLTVYVRDGSFPAQYDTASVVVSLTDVNDHSPVFRDSCYPLRVPENTDLSVIHTFLATDHDAGFNGDVTYSLSGENFDNMFYIDSSSGQLSSKPLDREIKSQFSLYITASDRGRPSLKGSCNITITVEDQNDNDPQFSKNKYSATVNEDAPIGSSVLQVQATDQDYGENAKVTYSLSNETQWLFRIDNETGVVSTVGCV